jgi:hypothetical protein
MCRDESYVARNGLSNALPAARAHNKNGIRLSRDAVFQALQEK